MLNKNFFIIALIFFLNTLAYSRDSIVYFFGKKADRRYYQNEFFSFISYKEDIGFKNSKTIFNIDSIEYSKSIEIKKYEEKINILDNKGYKRETESLILKFKTYSKGGAIQIDTSISVPEWTKTISVWLLNDGSDMEGFIYIKYPGKLVRYKIGEINHKKWKRFNIDIKEEKEGVIKRIKLINKDKRSNPQFENTIAISKEIEFISEKRDDPKIIQYKREINPTSLVSGFNVDKGILKIIADKPSYYRFNKGLIVEKDEFIILALESDSPYILEIIGGLPDNRKKLFVMQFTIEPQKSNHNLIFKCPDDVYKEFSESSSTVIWGIGVIPVKDRLDITIKKIILSFGI